MTPGFSLRDEGAGPLLRIDHASDFELAIGSEHSIRVDGQIDGDLPDGRQLRSGRQLPRSNPALNLVDELAIDGDAAVLVEPECELERSGHL